MIGKRLGRIFGGDNGLNLLLDRALGDFLAVLHLHAPRLYTQAESAAILGRAIGAKVTLRGDKMWSFLDRLMNIVLPRVRDFRGVSPEAFDGRGNYTLGLKDQLIFPEIDIEKIDKVKGMNICITTTAKTDPEKGTKGISAFIVEKGTPGFKPGRDEKKMGLKGSVTSELFFENVRIPEANLLGKENQGFKQFMTTLDAGRIAIAAMAVGLAQGAFEKAVAYSKQREQFNRPIATFQAVKHMCAEMAAELEPCRSLVWYAAHAVRAMPGESRLMACHAKAHLSEVGQFVARTATEVHGGMGFTDLLGLHYWFKRIGFNRQHLGSPEEARLDAARAQGWPLRAVR